MPKFRYNSLEEWVAVLTANPDWQNRSAIEMLKELGPAACSFYRAFRYWLGVNYSRREEVLIKEKYFPARPNEYKHQRNGRKGTNRFNCYSLEQWRFYKNQQEEWQGKTANQMVEMGGEARSFYSVFYNWLKKQTFSQDKRREILRSFFAGQKRKRTKRVRKSVWFKQDQTA